MNRLVAEKNNPQADVYWANEPVRAEVLKQQGITTLYSAPKAAGIPDTFKDRDGHWTGFSARERVLIVNKTSKDKPWGVRDYLATRFKGKTVIANPCLAPRQHTLPRSSPSGATMPRRRLWAS